MQLDAKQIPHIDQYFGVWCVQESTFLAQVERVRGMNIHVHLNSDAPKQAAARAERGTADVMYVQDGIAVISMFGPLMKQVSSMSDGTSTVMLRQAVRQAAKSPDVKAILLQIESPGGTAAGTMELADEVAKAAKAKPTWAYIEDLGASAAYWVASQASVIYANAAAKVGSIGTYAVLYDQSGAAAMEGIKVHVVRAGEFKGMGEPGSEITADHLKEAQRIVSQVNDFFLAGVGKGRKMPPAKMKEIADGRVHIGAEAQTMGLIDGVKTSDEVLGMLAKETKRMKKMMDDKTTNQAATYAELKAACVGADSDFLCKQLEAAATTEAAQRAWMGEQQQRLDAAKQEAAKVKAEAEKVAVDAETAKRKPGVPPLGDGKPLESSASDEDPATAWREKVQAKMRRGMNQAAAMSAVETEHPGLRQQWLSSHNAAHKRPFVAAN